MNLVRAESSVVLPALEAPLMRMFFLEICLRGYWSFFKALGLYSIARAAFEVWQKLRSL
jgi:hypothetical protein